MQLQVRLQGHLRDIVGDGPDSRYSQLEAAASWSTRMRHGAAFPAFSSPSDPRNVLKNGHWQVQLRALRVRPWPPR
jgi:hypothetical protein